MLTNSYKKTSIICKTIKISTTFITIYFQKIITPNLFKKPILMKTPLLYLLCICLTLYSFSLKGQCGSENFELLIETSLGTGQICENSIANVSVDVTPESYYALDQIDSIRWIWYVDIPGQGCPFSDILGGADIIETTFPPYTPTAQNNHLYDELLDLDCDALLSCVTIQPNIIELGIGTFGYVTCDDENVESHFNTVGLDLLLEPRADFDIISSSTICLNETVDFSNTGCFGDLDLSYWTVDGNTIQTNGNDVLAYSPTAAGTVEVCLHLINNCGEDIECKNLTIVPEPDALFSIPPELLDGLGCPGTYEFCNISDTITHYNEEYYWGVYYNGILQGQLDTSEYKICYDETFTTPGVYELVLTANNFACDTVQYSFSFTIVESSFATLIGSPAFCITDFNGYTPNVSYTGVVTDHMWTFDNGTPPTSTAPFPTNILFPPGTHEVILEVITTCGPQTYQTEVTIDSPTTITFSDIDDAYCTGQGDTLKVIPSSLGGVWSPNPFFNDSCLIIDNLPTGPNTFTYTFGSGACSTSESIIINITDTTAISLVPLQETFCEDDGIITLAQATPSGGIWSGLGVIDPISGLIDPSIIGAGNSSTIWYSYVNGDGCESVSNKTVLIEGLPEASLPQDSLVLCDVAGTVDLNMELSIQTLPLGFTDEWLGNCVTAAGILEPSCLGIGTFTLEYVVLTPNNCADTTAITIIVENFQLANAGADLSECASEGATITLTGSPEGGIWTGSNITADGIITITDTMDGDYVYTYTFGGANCQNQDDITVNIINLSEILVGLDDYCETETIVTLPDGSPSGGTWIYNGTELTNNELDISTLGPGNFILNYEVEETASNNEVCTNSIPVDLFIDALPNPIIDIPSELCINEPNTINNTTLEQYSSWNWDFDNGTMATGLAPTFEYTATGDYTITLSIQDTVCQQIFTWDVSVSSPPPPLAFAIDILSTDSCELLEVAYINQSQVDPNVTDVIYIWNFGNGMMDTTYSVNEAPDNIFYEAYDSDIFYTVTLSALNNCGDVIPAIDSVYVQPIPISQFSADYEVYCSGSTATFIDASTGNPVNTIIDLGDGSPLLYDYPFDTLSHQYFVGDIAETFTVQFISINPCGADTVTFTVEVVPVNVVAAFTVENDGIFCQNTPFCIEGTATPGASVWYDMGDGNTLFADDTCYTYSLDGDYTITQYALDNCGGLDTIQIPVSVLTAPVIEIPNINNPCLGESVEFSLMTSNDVTNVVWDFGDGNTSDEQNPVYTFQNPGTYIVTATATTIQSCSVSATTTIQIAPPINVSLLMEDSVCANTPVLLENTSNGSNYSCLWLIDQTTAIPGCSVVTDFETTGIYNISLTLTDNISGCESIKDTSLFVRPTPSAAFELQLIDSCDQNSYRIINLSTDANVASWSLGDGTSSILLDSIEHYYDSPGFYEIILLASYDNICFDTFSQIIEVPESLISIIAIPDVDDCEPFVPIIENQSIGNNLTYSWSTSNGLNFFDENIAPIFTTDLPSEDISIQLIVSDSITNCSDTSSITITVFDNPSLMLNTTDVTCNGGSDATITANTTAGSPGYTYDWSIPGNTNMQSDLSIGNYTLTVSDSNGCSDIATVAITQPDSIFITLDDLQNATCAGLEDGSISILASGGTTTTGSEFTYDWNIDLPLSEDSLSTISDLGAGFYTVTIADEVGCTGMASFTIEDGYTLEVIDTTLGISCEDMVDGQIQILAIENGSPNFLALLEGPLSDTLNSDAGVLNFNNLPTGNYQLSIIDQNNCMFEEEYLVPSWQNPTVNIQADSSDLFKCDSRLIVANATGSGLSYEWFPEIFFDCINNSCDSIIVSPDDDTIYDILVIDERDCTAEASVTITIDEERKLFVPNAFTPNGDGVNDIFRIRAGAHQAFLLTEIISFNVSDRWGNILYKAEAFHPYKNPEIGWDGTIDDAKAPSDIYPYWAELRYCDRDEIEIIKGHIQLIR